MPTVLTTRELGVFGDQSHHDSRAVRWYHWCMAGSLTIAVTGAHWDISWHRSIGRDSFWTPPHILIYLSGLVAGLAGAYLIFATTVLRKPELRETSIGIFGLRAPLGIFLAGWGGMVMLISAPFDNWWHSAYGLDVKIISPPHVLLLLGNIFVGFGGLVLIVAAMNRAADNVPRFLRLQKLVLYMGGVQLVQVMIFLMEFTFNIKLHSVSTYCALGMGIPLFLTIFSRVSRHPWAATIMAIFYLLYGISMILVLPLFPAHPKLGPVYFPVTHFVPPPFPPLLIFPALAVDLFLQSTQKYKSWQRSFGCGAVFMVVLVSVEWPFASFLMTKASENWFFGTAYYDYSIRPGWSNYLHIFYLPDSGRPLFIGLVTATILAMISSWVGILIGNWLRQVQR